jgi:hypothetical protein
VISEDIEAARSLAQYAVQAPDYYASQSETRVLARAVLALMNQLDVYEERAVCAEGRYDNPSGDLYSAGH